MSWLGSVWLGMLLLGLLMLVVFSPFFVAGALWEWWKGRGKDHPEY